MQPLSFRQAMTVRPDPDFETDMKRLLLGLQASAGPQRWRFGDRRLIAVAMGLLVVTVGVGTWYWWPLLVSEADLGPSDHLSSDVATNEQRNLPVEAVEQPPSLLVPYDPKFWEPSTYLFQPLRMK